MINGTLYVNGEPIEFEPDDEITVSFEFPESGPECRHCGTAIAEYVDGWHADSDDSTFCDYRFIDESDDDDDDSDDESVRARFTHEPDDSPMGWANGAGIRIRGADIQAWISVSDPRGAFTMNAWRGQHNEQPVTLLSVPHPDEPMPHDSLTLHHGGTYIVGPVPAPVARPTVPDDFPVRVLGPDDAATDRVTCGECGRSWDDAIVTGITPAPSGRCPFEYFH